MSRPKARAVDPLRYAQALLALAEEMHFGRAASRLGISQPSLSNQMSRLESSLGFLVFRRAGRAVALTRAGERYVEGMHEAMELARHAMSRSSSGEGDGTAIRIGFVSAAMFRVLPHALRRFEARFPSVRPVLLPRATERLLDDLEAGELDIGCARGPVERPGLHAASMATERLLAAVPARHPVAANRTVELNDLRREQVITFQPQQAASLADVIDDAWKRARCRPAAILQVDDWPGIIEHVRRGAGCSVVPESVAALRVAGVTYRPLRNCELRTGLTVVSRKDEPAIPVTWLSRALATAV